MDQRTYPMTDDLQEFIERCNSLGVTQAEIARRAKLSTAAVSYIFTGERAFSEPARSKMWTALFDVMREKGDQAIKFAKAAKLGTQYGKLSQLQTPPPGAEASWRDTHARVKDRLIESQERLIEIQDGIIDWYKERDSERSPRLEDLEKIAKLEKAIAEYRDLLGWKMNEAVAHDEAEELEGKIVEREKNTKSE